MKAVASIHPETKSWKLKGKKQERQKNGKGRGEFMNERNITKEINVVSLKSKKKIWKTSQSDISIITY